MSNDSQLTRQTPAQLPIAPTPFNFDDSTVRQQRPRLLDDDVDEEARGPASHRRQKTQDDHCLKDAYRAPLIFGDEENACALTIGTQTEEHLNSSDVDGSHSSDLLSHISERMNDDDDFCKQATDAQTDFHSTHDTENPVNGKFLVAEDDGFARVALADKVAENQRDQPTKGMVYYIVHTVLMSGNAYAAQQLFKAADHVAIMQLTFIRGVVCSILILLMVNRNVKATLWDPVTCRALPSLIFRCLQGGISVYIAFSSINFFNVSTVGIVCSLKPIIACLFGVSILGESMTWKDVICMGAVFIAVFLVIFGSEGQQSQSMAAAPWAMVALIAQPFLLAGGDIAMRKMRKMPEQLCSAYQNLTLTLLASIYMLASGLSFDFVWTLSSEAWMYLCLSCSLTILTQLAKANAFKFSESSRLQKLSFLPNVWQFSIDIAVLSVAFSTMQLTGFALLVAFYVCELTYSVVERRMANKREFVCNDEEYTKL